MKTSLLILTAVITTGEWCLAQETHPSFEVASIKPTKTISPGMWDVLPGGRMVARNATLKRLILIAYRLQDYQVTGGPAWISGDQFDIDAKAEAASRPTDEQSRLMLQALLEDRFQLKVRRETRDAPIYVLVTVKNGPRPSADQTPPKPSPPVPGGPLPRGAMRMGIGVATGAGVQLSGLVRFLGATLGRPVIDKTGLSGLYDIDLHWTPDQVPANLPPGMEAPPSDGPSLSTALQEQAGLKLESAIGPVQVLAIERAAKPTEN